MDGTGWVGGALTSNAASVLGGEVRADDLEASLVVLVIAIAIVLVASTDWPSESAEGEEGDNESLSEVHCVMLERSNWFDENACVVQKRAEDSS